MILEFVDKWKKYKKDLEEEFKNTKRDKYMSYKDIVKLLFDKVINKDEEYGEFDTENILVIDDGDYQGTQIFVLHRKRYQPNVEDYVYTSTYYGSCSGCDTIEAIYSEGDWDEEFITDEQVKDYMQLSLHLLQRCKYMED